MNEIRFEIKAGCLYAANTGQRFDAKAVVSICSQYLSAKSARAGWIETPDCSDEELVATLKAQQIQLYTFRPNLLISDRNAEDETSRDYAGRCLLELLQNADDAMSPAGAAPEELIGAKGLGFKSVLEITDTPQIFSGPFSFGFDQERSRACLGRLAVGGEVGAFRIPHAVERDSVVDRLLESGFATVVKLPLRDVAAAALVEKELEELQPHFLLLSQHLDRVDIHIPGLVRQLQREGARGSANGAQAKLRVRRGRKTEHESSWRVWRDTWPAPEDKQKRLSVAIAVHVVNGTLVPTSGPLPLHVFYPTQEQVGANLLIHGAFDVAQNRQRVRPGPNDAQLLERIGAMASRIARSEPPLEILQVLRMLLSEAPRGKPKLLPRLIAHSIREALIEAEFIPVIARGSRKVSPHEARITSPGFAGLLNPAAKRVADAGIVRPELEPVHSVLQDLESEPLQTGDYAQLFRHARCRSREACLAAARAMLRTCLTPPYVPSATLAALREAPIWPISDGRIRSLSATPPLLLSRPQGWPDWCEADALDPQFAAELFPNGAISKDWEKLLSGFLLATPAEHLERCLAPTVACWNDEQWSELGWQALERVEQWAAFSEWSKLRPYAPDAKLGGMRDALVQVMRVPAGKSWVRARHCYARTEIKGPAFLTRFFKLINGRALCGYPSEAKGRFSADRWRALLRYLGVSWEPKILLLQGDPDRVLEAPDEGGYRNEILRHDGIRYLKVDWHLEGFPQCLGDAVPAPTLMETIAALQSTSSDLRAEWFKVTGTDKTHLPAPYHSFVQFQLRCVAYLPVKPNIWGKRLAQGREAFWPQTGIRGITPDLDLAGFKDPRRAALKPALAAALKFQTGVPVAWEAWISWNAALVAAVDRGDVPGGLRSARDFYELMLDCKHGGKDGRKPARLACADSTSPTGLRTVPRADATWIDRPALALPEVLDALSAAGLPFLPALLDAAPNASGQLGIARASEKVVVVPSYEDAPAAQARLQGRLDARWRAIAVQCEAKRVKLPPKPALRGVHGLTLSISLSGKKVAEIASSAFHHADEWLIDMGNPWEAVAAALSDGLGHGADLRYRFAAILSAPNLEAVTRALLEDGIPSYKLSSLRLNEDEDEDNEAPTPVLSGEVSGSGTEVDGMPLSPANDEDGSHGGDALPPPPPPLPPLPPPELDRPAGNQYASGTLKHRPLYDSSNNGGGSGSGDGGWNRQHAAGMAGEEWLRGLVAAGLPQGWTVSLNERDADAGESDIVVRSPTAEWHIEVKTLSTERLYWSELERQKAERQAGRYWMCFLVRQGYAWRLHWSWDPLTDLLPCERRVQWQWDRESEGPKLAKESWQPIGGVGAPMLPPDRATIVIRMLDAQVRALPEDDVALSLFWQKVRGA